MIIDDERPGDRDMKPDGIGFLIPDEAHGLYILMRFGNRYGNEDDGFSMNSRLSICLSIFEAKQLGDTLIEMVRRAADLG